MVTGTGGNSDELAQEVNKDLQVAALDNGAPPTVLRLQKRYGK